MTSAREDKKKATHLRHGPHERDSDLSSKTLWSTPNRKSTANAIENSLHLIVSSVVLFPTHPPSPPRHLPSGRHAAARDDPLPLLSPPLLASFARRRRGRLRRRRPQPAPPPLRAPPLDPRAAAGVRGRGRESLVRRHARAAPRRGPRRGPREVQARCNQRGYGLNKARREGILFQFVQGTKIVDESHDQDTTDLHKCVSFITRNPPGPDKSNLCILVLGALGGRFDHEMGNINVLYHFSNIRIILLSDDCSIFLLPKTHIHEIHIERSVEGPHCGLIPIGTPSASTTTTGLRWNLDNTSMSYGGLISTSNIVEEEKVTVASDSDLIWTISLRNDA